MYDRSLLVNTICNRAVCDLLGKMHAGFAVTDQQLERTSGERHGAHSVLWTLAGLADQPVQCPARPAAAQVLDAGPGVAQAFAQARRVDRRKAMGPRASTGLAPKPITAGGGYSAGVDLVLTRRGRFQRFLQTSTCTVVGMAGPAWAGPPSGCLAGRSSMTSDPRARYERSMARDSALRRISMWTAALAAGGVIGSGAFAAVAYAQSQPSAGDGSGSTGSSQGSSQGGTGSSPISPDGGQGSSEQGQGGFAPPQNAPMPQQQSRQPMGVSGGS